MLNMYVSAQQLIESPRDMPPHVVVLGAGASLAAFPDGDAAGLRLPIMENMVDVVGLRPLIDEAGISMEHQQNFEEIYSQLASEPRYARTAQLIERRTHEYFSSLTIPDRATIYDRLLISLRPTDAVFTFNWDPFLFDAYQRNHGIVPLPEIFFFHGNVRIGACGNHDKWGARGLRCPECGQPFTDVPLLYPIRQKDYSNNRYIRSDWESAKILLRDAFTLTIFGYGAPDSDVDAVNLLRQAWLSESARELEHIEIIDTASQSELHARWSKFTPSYHYHVKTTFNQSRIARWPRRTCESLFYPMTQGLPCDEFPLPTTDNITELQQFAADIVRHEAA
jgi:hypothetical protein